MRRFGGINVEGLDMLNVRIKYGYYLARRFEDSSLVILYLDSTGSARESDGYWTEQNLYYWIADEPLDLELLAMMDGVMLR